MCFLFVIIQRNGSLMMIMTLVSADQDESEKSLLEAARLGNVDQIAELIKQGVHISCKDASGYSALHWASLYGHIDERVMGSA